MDLLFIWLAFAVICAIVASTKNRSALGWLLLGAIFGVFALIVLAFLPRIDDPTPNCGGVPQHRKCPYCAEQILSEATKCKHCGSEVEPAATPTPARGSTNLYPDQPGPQEGQS